MYRIIIIIILLTLIGFNVFYFIGDTTEYVTEKTKEVSKNTLEQSIEGTKKVASTTQEILDHLEEDIEREREGPIQRGGIQKTEYEPDTMNSLIQESRKSGYCYIGNDNEDRRVCLRVGVNDDCLSKKIYPTMDVCINPNLRP